MIQALCSMEDNLTLGVEKKYKKITVNLEDDLYKKFKVRLAEKDEKMKDVISEAIKEYLRK